MIDAKPKLLLFFGDQAVESSAVSIERACQDFDPDAKKIAMASGINGAEVMLLPKSSFETLVSKLKYVAALSEYAKKLARYYSMYPFEGVVAVGSKACLASIIFKLRFNSNLVWYLENEATPLLSKFWFRRLASLFCDKLVVDSSRLPTRFPAIDARNPNAVVEALTSILRAS